MKAIWNNQVLAESANTIIVEGNHYFPPDSINKQFFEESSHSSACFWKGEAAYFSISVGGETNDNAAWYYPSPKSKASHIKNYVAFWKGIEVHK